MGVFLHCIALPYHHRGHTITSKLLGNVVCSKSNNEYYISADKPKICEFLKKTKINDNTSSKDDISLVDRRSPTRLFSPDRNRKMNYHHSSSSSRFYYSRVMNAKFHPRQGDIRLSFFLLFVNFVWILSINNMWK